MVANVVLSMLSTGWLQEEQIQAWFNSQAQLIALIKLVQTTLTSCQANIDSHHIHVYCDAL